MADQHHPTDGEHTEHSEGFWRKYWFSTDHKVIGIQYGITALAFMLFGFLLMLLMRWQLASPGVEIPLLGALTPELYNQFGAMHGTIMVFLGIVPLAVGAFGNYVVPLQIGAPDMAFPRLNMASYHFFFWGGAVMMASFLVPGGAAKAGWTSYPPLADIETMGQTVWLWGMVLLITSSLLGAVNFITTIIQLRTDGMTFFRMPFFVWAQFITAFLLLLAFPPLEAAGILQLADRLLDTSFFLPSGLVTADGPLEVAGGGSPLLWQHLFWFLAHPEVYVLILPAMGIVAEIIANNTRKPLWGYRLMVYSLIFLGFMSFIVWAHHMFITGMGTAISSFFQVTTMIISVPSVVILSALVISLYGGSIRFTVPMMFALGFLPMFAIGGLTGLPLGLAATDIPLHDSYYVIGHFHYVVAPGTIMALFAGIYYWYPKVTGREMNTTLGKIHFWGSIISMNGIFFPMLYVGMAGVSRRLFDGGLTYSFSEPVIEYNIVMSVSAAVLAVAQIPFIINFFMSIKRGKKVESDNHWEATTLDWSATPTPPVPHGNFVTIPRVYHDPYEYNMPGSTKGFVAQNDPTTVGIPAETVKA